MNKKYYTKAALFSAFVFPGAEYFILGKKVHRAIAFIITLCALAVMMTEAYHKAQIIAEKIVYGVISIDIKVIREAIISTPGNLSPETVSALSLMIGAVWLVSIVDCYRLGTKQSPLKTG